MNKITNIIAKRFSQKKDGFTVMEILVMLLITGVLIAVSMPIISKTQWLVTGSDKNTTKCITSKKIQMRPSAVYLYQNEFNVNHRIPDASKFPTMYVTNDPYWYDQTTGVVTEPSSFYDFYCNSAYNDIYNDKSNSIATTIWFADHGKTSEKLIAKALLKGVCDKKGGQACDYFINSCIKNGSTSVPFCDDTTGYLDLTSYLHYNKTDTSNTGALYIKEKLDKLILRNIEKITNEVDYACIIAQKPTGSPIGGDNLNSNIACTYLGKDRYIKACNYGNKDACLYAYNNDYNKSCYAVKNAWPSAPTGKYKLTSNGTPLTNATRQVYCNMSSLGSAAISGCSANPRVPNDCINAYNNVYNRSCSGIFTYLTPPEDGVYQLSSATAGTVSNMSQLTFTDTACTTNAECIAKGPGTKCADGTIYAGVSTDTPSVPLFATPVNQSVSRTNWANPKNQIIVGAQSSEDGVYNTKALLKATDIFSPYKAAQMCNNRRTGMNYERDDWYLPSINELKFLMTNVSTIAHMASNSAYMSSTEYDKLNYNYAKYVSAPAPANKYAEAPPPYVTNSYTAKADTQRVKCMSNIEGVSCSEIGETCTDGAIFAGIYNGVKLYTTPTDETNASWNNGKIGHTKTNAIDTKYGYNNLVTLSTSPVNTYSDTPFSAVNKCAELNQGNTGSAVGATFDNGVHYYRDWYLPSKDEAYKLYLYRDLGAFASTFTGSYATSTEYSANYERAYNWTGGTEYKYTSFSIRCIRRNTW